jgi:tRNA-specific 2-thiouridylase
MTPALPDPDPVAVPDPDTVIVGMSGGVDSAVAALLLREQGHEVQGLFMSNWEEDDDAYCTAAADFQDARRVCEALDIPLHRVSFAGEYRQRVFRQFLLEYGAGRTPNPDVLCNREIKFGVCLDYMHRLGAGRIATGHYARLRRTEHGTELLKAADESKDQSYFLHSVDPAALGRTLFPLGELRKDEVRRRAHAAGLSVHDKPDSTGICFIGERPFEDFLGRYIEGSAGPIEDPAGMVIGEHRGLSFYTIGQRSGLRMGGRAGSAQAPWYVAAKDLERNALIVVQDHDHPLLMSAGFEVEELRWLAGAAPPEPHAARPNAAARPDAARLDAARAPFECTVKTRYRQRDLACSVEFLTAGRARVGLRQPARAITPGQYAVFYRGDLCLGGGIIAESRRLPAERDSPPMLYNFTFSAEKS